MKKDLRFPIGKFDADEEIKNSDRRKFVKTIENLPNEIYEAVDGLDDEQLDTKYRPDGWTVRQLVHHIADSHLNALCRFKLALTEDAPTIRPYLEDKWANLADSKMPLDASLKIIEGVHARWTNLLNSLSDEDFERKLNHPESGDWTLQKMLEQYAWHSKHHTAHITELRKRENWSA